MATFPQSPVDLGGGWHRLESGYYYPGHDAIYIAADNGEAAIFDTGISASVPRVLGALDGLGLSPAAVKFVLISHSHLDHSAGAGKLMASLPSAKCYASERACPRVRDPAPLCDGARKIYTDDFDRLYGEVLPVDAARVAALKEGDALQLGKRELRISEVPGHTFDHLAVFDPAAECIFAGDTFGVFLAPEYKWPTVLRIPAAPTQFAPDHWKRSVRRIAQSGAARVFATHYGVIDGDLAAHADKLCEELDWIVALARRARAAKLEPDAVEGYLRAHMRERWSAQLGATDDNFPAEHLDLELRLCEMGIALWMNKHLDSYAD